MERTTYVWVSYLEENLELLIYPMFHGFLLARKMVCLPFLMLPDQLRFLTVVCCYSACADCLRFDTNFPQYHIALFTPYIFFGYNEIHQNQPFSGDQ